MKIKLLSIAAGPDGVRHPGIHDIPDAEAKALIASGFAVSAEPEAKAKPAPAIERAQSPEPETADVRPAKRTPAKPKDL